MAVQVGGLSADFKVKAEPAPTTAPPAPTTTPPAVTATPPSPAPQPTFPPVATEPVIIAPPGPETETPMTWVYFGIVIAILVIGTAVIMLYSRRMD